MFSKGWYSPPRYDGCLKMLTIKLKIFGHTQAIGGGSSFHFCVIKLDHFSNCFRLEILGLHFHFKSCKEQTQKRSQMHFLQDLDCPKIGILNLSTVWPDVKIKSSPIFPIVNLKESTDVLDWIVPFFKMAPKYLGYFFKKICSQDLSRIAQSGHTACQFGIPQPVFAHSIAATSFCFYLQFQFFVNFESL